MMFARLRFQSLLIAGLMSAACAAWAQTGGIEGKVTGADGQPVKGAVVKFLREDIRGNYKVNTDKKGHYLYVGLPLGMYRISVEVDGKEVDFVDKAKNKFGDTTTVDFDLHARAQQNAALNKAAETGNLSKDMTRGLTADQKAQIEEQMKEREKVASKNKALNDAFNAGRAAKDAKQWDEAVTQFQKASEMDPNQAAVWSNMAESYVGLGDSKTTVEEKNASYDKAFEAYQKAIALAPDDGALHNNYALALVKEKKIDEAQKELQAAAQLDPSSAAKYYYNLGAVLTNINQPEAAGAAFKKAIDTDPTYAEAQYQYAIYLIGKLPPPGPDGKIVAPPEVTAALQKYLELAPNGPNAQNAKDMLASLSASVQTNYTNPNAKKTTKKK